MQTHEKSINSGLVHLLKNGKQRVTKKALREKYGADKLSIANETLKHPDALEKYRKEARRTSKPITSYQLAEIQKIDIPRHGNLLDGVLLTPRGGITPASTKTPLRHS